MKLERKMFLFVLIFYVVNYNVVVINTTNNNVLSDSILGLNMLVVLLGNS